LAYNQQLQNQTLGMNAQQQAFVQEMSKYLLPAQVAGMLKNLSTPTYAPTNTIPGTDYLSAMGLTNQSQQANANATNAQNNAMMSGLFNLASAGTKAYFSDIRVKENIVKLGALPNGLNIYEFDYKLEFKDIAGHGKHIGVMAQEVEKVIPYAVIKADNGYKMVNYSMLGL
jgi:hypothetical protein